MPENPARRAARQKKYNARPEQIRRRSQRNKARRIAEKKYGKAALRGKDVHHKSAGKSGSLNNSPSNLSVVSVKKNRGTGNNKWRRRKRSSGK